MRPVGILEILDVPQRRVLQDIHYGGLQMNEQQWLGTLRRLVSSDEESRDAQQVERMAWKRSQ